MFPKYNGSYNLYHRIDGVLFAITWFELTPSYYFSLFWLYDPDYKWLSPGTFTAIREIEYIKKMKETWRPNLKYYGMLDLVIGWK